MNQWVEIREAPCAAGRHGVALLRKLLPCGARINAHNEKMRSFTFLWIAAACAGLTFAPACTDEGEDDGHGGSGAAPLTGGGFNSGTVTSTGVGGDGAGGQIANGGNGGSGGNACDGDPAPTGSPIANTDEPCTTLTTANEPAARVVFLDIGQDSEFSQEIELLYSFRYAVKVPSGEEASYSVEQERCWKPAGETETCDTVVLAAPTMECEGPIFGPKFGVDSTLYQPGANEFRFTMRLRKDGCVIESADSFSMTLTYNP